MTPTTQKLFEDMLAGDRRALARLMTFIDNRHEETLAIMALVYQKAGKARRIGVTGPPGAGKSTLTDKMIRAYRAEGKTVGVVAIDPSSPFTGGAVLGDRIRMQDHNADAGVFIRSLGSHGAHGGLSRATRDVVHLLDAAGFDVVIIETVGVGQTELDIMAVAHTTLVVLVPESGDTIQTMKAGLMEIADIFVVNKADRDGADRIAAELLALSEMYSQDYNVPVLKAVATRGEGVAEIMQAIVQHTVHLKTHPSRLAQHQSTREEECLVILLSEIHALYAEKFKADPWYVDVHARLTSGKLNPYSAVQELLTKLNIN